MKLKKNINCGILGMFVAISFTIFIASCSNSSSPSSNNNTTTSNTVHPKIGSTFTDSAYTRDTNLNVDPKTGTVLLYTLTDTNFSIGGKTNVYTFVSSTDTVFLHYESNGDFSNYATFGVGVIVAGQEWVTLPLQSQGIIPITPLTTILAADTILVTGSAKGTGTETDMVSGHSVNASNTSLNVSAYAPQLMATTTGFVNTSFAPSLGFLTHFDESTHGVFFGYNLSGGLHRFLINYNLK